MKAINIVLITFLGFIITEMLFSCAQVVAPTGGKKDTLSPKLVKSFPENQTKNFKGKIIELQFDEYINVDNIQQQLLITPAIEGFYNSKNLPKGVRLTFEEPFKDSTTYSLNFREAFKDITERNPAKNIRIVFSTGSTIDSLKIEGNVKDLIENKGVLDATVGLYKYSDTLRPAKIKPYYFTKTDSSGNFKIENIATGKYRVYAITDVNNNLLYEETKEKIGIIKDTILLTKNLSNLNINLAKVDNSPVKILKTRATSSYYYIDFNRGIKKAKIQFAQPSDSLTYQQNEANQLRIFNTRNLSTDTTKVNLIVIDSLDRSFEFSQKIKFKIKAKKEESIKDDFKYDIYPQNGKDVDLKEIGYKITFSKPIKTFDFSKIEILNDTLKKVELKESYLQWNDEKTELKFKIDNAPKAKEVVKITIPTNSFISVENDTNKVIKQINPIRDPENYGLIEGKVTNPHNKSFIVQLLNEKKEVERQVIHNNTSSYTFDFVKPGIYMIRLIVDDNKNQRWDAGNVDKNILPEDIMYIKDKIKLKQNFELSGFDFQIGEK